MPSVNPMSSLFTHRYIIRSLIFLLNISLETRLLGHVYFETWESAAVYQQSRSKSCRIYTSGMYITNSIWKENVCLMNNTHLSSAATQVFLNGTKNLLIVLSFHYVKFRVHNLPLLTASILFSAFRCTHLLYFFSPMRC